MTSAHATSDLLAGYAGGALSQGMCLMVASHLTFCPPCRVSLSRIEAVGGAALAMSSGVAMSPAACAEALARLDAPADAEPAAGDAGGDAAAALPVPLRQCLAGCAQDIRWRFLLPGLSECPLDGFEGEDVSLLRARPGVRIPAHTHSGEEATLLLSGRMRDGDRVYGRGDLALADHSCDHRPEIIGAETCLCLVVLSGRMRFTGPVGRALNLFAK